MAAVLGWAVRPLAVALDRPIPLVTWWGVVPIWLLTLVIGAIAVQTWLVLQRAVARGDARRRDRLSSDQAVNRMVLGKAAALAGAAVLGGYGGFALSQVGLATELADARLLRAGAASLGGLVMLLMGLLLEKACRVRKDRT